MWFQVELPQPVSVTELQFASTAGGRGGGGGGRGAVAAPGAAPAPAPTAGYPRGFKVEASVNGTTWVTTAEGRGAGSPTIIAFRPVPAKFVRITQTAPAEGPATWSIQQLRIYEAARTR